MFEINNYLSLKFSKVEGFNICERDFYSWHLLSGQAEMSSQPTKYIFIKSVCKINL